MKMALCAGAFALAMAGLLPGMPAQASDYGIAQQGQAATIDIDYIRHALKLTEQQARYWPPVEVALRALARRQHQPEASGFMHRMSQRAVSVVLTGAAIHRLAVAARPLVAVLTDEQKQTAMGLAQEMGLGPVLAALN
jgi:hypothetical protein